MTGRRVIFVPDEFWTDPPPTKEINMSDHLNHGDYRRAAAITLHHRRGDKTGMVTLVEETSQADRGPQLLLAVLEMHAVFLTLLRTDDALNLAADWVGGMGALDGDDETGIIAACRILDAHARSDLDAINAELTTVDDRRATTIFIGLLDVYEATLPEISGTAGLDWIQRHANYMAGGELDDGGA